jgi:hypothetical protein
MCPPPPPPPPPCFPCIDASTPPSGAPHQTTRHSWLTRRGSLLPTKRTLSCTMQSHTECLVLATAPPRMHQQLRRGCAAAPLLQRHKQSAKQVWEPPLHWAAAAGLSEIIELYNCARPGKVDACRAILDPDPSSGSMLHAHMAMWGYAAAHLP